MGATLKSHNILRPAWLKMASLVCRERKKMGQINPQTQRVDTPKVEIYTGSHGIPGPRETWLKSLPLDSE